MDLNILGSTSFIKILKKVYKIDWLYYNFLSKTYITCYQTELKRFVLLLFFIFKVKTSPNFRLCIMYDIIINYV